MLCIRTMNPLRCHLIALLSLVTTSGAITLELHQDSEAIQPGFSDHSASFAGDVLQTGDLLSFCSVLSPAGQPVGWTTTVGDVQYADWSLEIVENSRSEPLPVDQTEASVPDSGGSLALLGIGLLGTLLGYRWCSRPSRRELWSCRRTA
jgi:hypothetical protein